MAEFQRTVKEGWRTLDFYFKPIITPNTTKYFITAEEKNEVLISFEMVKFDDQWTVLQPAPEWIMKLETQLSKILEEASQN